MAQAQQAGQDARNPYKYKAPKEAHVANTKYGMGDNYGLGIRAKLGRMREGTGMVKVSDRKMGIPPKSLA